jgi:hypothetical protein
MNNTLIKKESTIDFDGLDEILNSLIGQDLNIYISGEIGGYSYLQGFDWSITESENGAMLFLEDDKEDKHFRMDIDIIDRYEFDESMNELLIFTELGIIQLWSNTVC